MIKALELIGFILIGVTIYAFLFMGESEQRWPVFWGSAAGVLGIIAYRQMARKKAKT